MKINYKYAVVLLFLVTLGVRLYLSFSSNAFDYDSYFSIRQAEQIKSTGLPAFHDQLSYGGKFYPFMPLFEYLLAAFGLFMPLQVAASILPQLLLALCIIPVYLIAFALTKDEYPAFIAALFSSLIPAFFSSTVYSVSSFSLFMLLFLFLIYSLISAGKNYVNIYIFLIILITLTSPLSLILIPILWMHQLMLKLQKINERGIEYELILFSTFFILLANFLVYKKAILMHGIKVIFENLPIPLFTTYFSNITIIDAITYVGLFQLFFGLYAIYKFSFAEAKFSGRTRANSLLISIIFVTAVLLWFKLIPIIYGIITFGFTITILSAGTFNSILSYVRKTHFSRYYTYLTLIILAGFVVTSVIPTFVYSKENQAGLPSDKDILAFKWISENTPRNSVVAVQPEEGHILSAIGKRKNVIDKNFILSPDVTVRYGDVLEMFLSQYETSAFDFFREYKVNYIFLSEHGKKELEIYKISYITDERCFKKMDIDAELYQITCELK